MERIISSRDAWLPDMAWASWDFFPSPWNGGTLLGNCIDDPQSPFVGIAAPGVSLCGESGFDTSRWRRAVWPTAAAFLERIDPDRFEVVELVCLRSELPDDFSEWTARATAAHIDRLRSFDLHRPAQLQAAELADALHVEMEDAFPGALERFWAEGNAPVRRERERRGMTYWRARLLERFPDLRMSSTQVFDLVGQAFGFAVLYGLYHLIRPTWQPKGAQVGIADLPNISVGELALWFYGIGHVVVPLAFLTWLYFRRPGSFAIARDTLVIAGVLTIAAYLAYAPRAVYAVASTEEIPASALPTMPALHLAVALALAFFGLRLSRTVKAKLCWAAYPMLVTLVLVISQSRYPALTIFCSLLVTAVSWVLAGRLVPRLRPLIGRAPGQSVGVESGGS